MQEAGDRFVDGLPDDAVPRRLQDLHGQHRRQRLSRRQARKGEEHMRRNYFFGQIFIILVSPQAAKHPFFVKENH